MVKMTLNIIIFLVLFSNANASETTSKKNAKISIELNSATTGNNACSVAFVTKNKLSTEIENISFEAVLFNKEGRISKTLLLKMGYMPAGKTRVKRFVLKGVVCENTASVLLNDIKTCKGEGLTPRKCLSLIEVSSKQSGLSFGL